MLADELECVRKRNWTKEERHFEINKIKWAMAVW